MTAEQLIKYLSDKGSKVELCDGFLLFKGIYTKEELKTLKLTRKEEQRLKELLRSKVTFL